MNKVASDYVNVLRGIAILGVVSVHSLFSTNEITQSSDYNLFSYSMSLGKYGVELFFMISGFLMYSLYGSASPINLRRYFRKRILRIYPLWLFFLFLNLTIFYQNSYGGVFAVINAEGSGNHFLASKLGILITGLTFTFFLSASLWNTVIPGGWSIQVEVLHYFLFAILRKVSLTKVLAVVASINGLTALIQVIVAAGKGSNSHILATLDTWSRLGLYSSFSFFLFGVLGGYFSTLTSTEVRSLLNPWDPNRFLLSFAFFALSLTLIPTPFGKTMEAIGVLFVFLVSGWFVISKAKLCSVFQSLGQYSYFIYFSHFLILDFMVLLYKKTPLDFTFPFAQKVIYLPLLVITLGISWILGKGSMRYFEKPLMRLGN